MKNLHFLRSGNRCHAKLSVFLLIMVFCYGFVGAVAAEETSKDEVMLRKLFDFHSKMANQGNLESVVKLGGMYERGEGVAQDRERAMELYRYAADRGSKSALELLDAIESNASTTKAGNKSLNIKVPKPKISNVKNDDAKKKQKELENKLQREKAAAEAARIELERVRRAQQEEEEKQRKLQADLAKIQQVQEQLARERAKAEAARREMELLRQQQEEQAQKQKELERKREELQAKGEQAQEQQKQKNQAQQSPQTQQEDEEQKKKTFSSNPCNTPAARFMSTCN